jgi:hypothetical protein
VNDFDHWLSIKAGLKDGFDRICGDTFCGGDYGNLQALSFRCSVSSKLGNVHACVWVFAGSYETVTASTGNVVVNAKTWSCKVPVGAGVTVAQLMDALDPAKGTTQPIDRTIPGTTATAYQALLGCLP